MLVRITNKKAISHRVTRESVKLGIIQGHMGRPQLQQEFSGLIAALPPLTLFFTLLRKRPTRWALDSPSTV
jgi:hypothetical protein